LHRMKVVIDLTYCSSIKFWPTLVAYCQTGSEQIPNFC
jgi:hypothetical protein